MAIIATYINKFNIITTEDICGNILDILQLFMKMVEIIILICCNQNQDYRNARWCGNIIYSHAATIFWNNTYLLQQILRTYLQCVPW
jgi:hypothetical protein